jgi:uroporphyrinogen-III synthase
VSQCPPPRILVTRSEPGASETAARLTALGYAPIVEPLFAIVPLEVTLPAFDALAFTSANGVRRLAVLSARRDVPVFCVGDRTAEAAREAGFANVTSADGDVTALGDLILSNLPGGARLLHAGNAESRGDLSGRLSAQGVAASFVALFQAEPVAAPGPELARHLTGGQAFDAALIHSPRAATILAGMIRAADRPCPIAIAAISPAAAAPLAGLTQGLATASTPTEDALLSSLANLVSG